jgi:hypothetical protein
MLLQATKISVHFLIVSHTLKFRLYIPFYVMILSTPLALAYSKDLPHENTVALTKTAAFFTLMCMATSIRDLHLFIYYFYCHSQNNSRSLSLKIYSAINIEYLIVSNDIYTKNL